MPPRLNAAPETAAATMWMMNQAECRAGTSGATATYTVIASPWPTASSSVTGNPSQRAPVRSAYTRYASATNAIVVVMNSYMLPHGSLPAARPRATTPVTWVANATTVRPRPARARRSTRGLGPPSDPRAAAHSAACANIAAM